MISIISPCYNVEPFLQAAVESVLNQTCTDWELILVDDGSTDATPQICARYAETDKRISFYSGPNRGVSAARNIGLEHASGEYIAFIDPDDVMSPDNLEYLLSLLTEYGADMAAASFRDFISDHQLSSIQSSASQPDNVSIQVLSGAQATEQLLYQNRLFPSLWGKLFRRELFNDIRFVVGEIYEDLNVFPSITMNCRKVINSSHIVYYYRQNPDSQLHTFKPNRFDALKVTQRIEHFMAENHPELLPAATDRRLSANFNILGLVLANAPDQYRQCIEDCTRFIKNNRRVSLTNPKVRLKNKIGILMSYLPTPVFHILLRQAYTSKPDK